jgi:hypothetical protein
MSFDSTRWAGTGCSRRTLLLLGMGLRLGSARAQQPQILRTLQDASRALQATNAASFLSYFDGKSFSEYARLEEHVVALTSQSEIGSSIQMVGFEAEGEVFHVEVDWVLQITPRSRFGKVQSRRRLIALDMQRNTKNEWKVTRLDPVDFFRP